MSTEIATREPNVQVSELQDNLLTSFKATIHILDYAQLRLIEDICTTARYAIERKLCEKYKY